MIRLRFFALACLVLLPLPLLADDKTPAPAAPSQQELEKQFSEALTGHVMIGQFTTTGAPADQPVKEDRYTLGKVVKLENGLWSFETHMQYGDKDVKFKMAFPVKWAGDTPMISLTDLPIPGLGIFTARILVYRGQYAGTWSAGDHGGLMFGKIVKAGEETKPAEKSAAPEK
jgi:hypothetical protein